MNQPQIHLVVCLDKCGAQRFAPRLSEEILHDANVFDAGVRPFFAQEHVRAAHRRRMTLEMCIWHTILNDLEQPCGFFHWQAFFGIANFDETHCVDFDNLKSLPNPTGDGLEFSFAFARRPEICAGQC